MKKKVKLTVMMIFSLFFTILFAMVPHKSLPDTPKKNNGENPEKKDIQVKIHYNPPFRGAPNGRIAGGSRGNPNETRLYLLIPDHTGLTVSEQPCLYYYISKVSHPPMEFTLIKSMEDEVILHVPLKTPDKTGIKKIELSRYDTSLEIGVYYRWCISFPGDGKTFPAVGASGDIIRVRVPEKLEAELTTEGRDGSPFVLAKSGIWYDALAGLHDLMNRFPGDPYYNRQFLYLLEQAGLPDFCI